MQKENTEFTKYLYGLQKIRFFWGQCVIPQMQKANTEFTKYFYELQKFIIFWGAVCNPTNAKGK